MIGEVHIGALLSEMATANGTSETLLRKYLSMEPDRSCIAGWNLSNCVLKVLPESFGMIRTTGTLLLSKNQLTSLPESFGSITVGGDLLMSNNQLSSLPESFGSITVGGNLWLAYNQLKSLPGSFGMITVGGNLSLRGNRITKRLPHCPNVCGTVM